MKQLVSQAIILNRTDYGEADRIITFLTPGSGKVRAIAKGVKKSKSKLAGGIELFSVSEITYIIGRSDINTLISTRLNRHFGNIVSDINRTNAGYEFIRVINKVTEDAAEESYFNLLATAFESLNDSATELVLTQIWFNLQLLKLMGHSPNMAIDIDGQKLRENKKYDFHFDQMKFGESQSVASFTAPQIKFLRLGLQAVSPNVLKRVEGHEKLSSESRQLAETMLRTFVQA